MWRGSRFWSRRLLLNAARFVEGALDHGCAGIDHGGEWGGGAVGEDVGVCRPRLTK